MAGTASDSTVDPVPVPELVTAIEYVMVSPALTVVLGVAGAPFTWVTVLTVLRLTLIELVSVQTTFWPAAMVTEPDTVAPLVTTPLVLVSTQEYAVV